MLGLLDAFSSQPCIVSTALPLETSRRHENTATELCHQYLQQRVHKTLRWGFVLPQQNVHFGLAVPNPVYGFATLFAICIPVTVRYRCGRTPQLWLQVRLHEHMYASYRACMTSIQLRIFAVDRHCNGPVQCSGLGARCFSFPQTGRRPE